MDQIVIGFTGSIGSGCTEIAKGYLAEEKDFSYYSLSDYIKKHKDEELKGVRKVTVLDYQDFGNKMRKENGKEFLAKIIADTIDKDIKGDPEKGKRIVIDSIRNCGEVEFLRNKYPNFFLIGVYAERDVRWSRLKLMEIYDRDEKLFDKVEERDQGEEMPYGQQIKVCMDIADIIIINNGDFKECLPVKKELHDDIEIYLKCIEKPGYRPPSLMEINMNKAYISSFNSRCIKRQVGAVIVEGDKEKIISEGFNHVPGKKVLLSCEEKDNRCYREKRRDAFYKTIEECSEYKQDITIPKVKMLDLCRALHAEEDAILNALISGHKNFNGCKLYTTTFPCMMCAKKIIAVGIKEIIFVEPYPVKEAYDILKEANVEIKVFRGIKYISFHKLFKKS